MNKKEGIIKYRGELDLAGHKMPCYVLEDGTRVLSGRGMQEALKMVDEAEVGKQKPGTRLKRYLEEQKSLRPYVYKEKRPDHYDPIICFEGEKVIHGYEATVLVDIANAFLELRKETGKENKKLPIRQAIISDQCEILVRAFAKVGIIALIDEATGYQKVREETLQEILRLYVSEEILKWQKIYHSPFYEQLFRL